MANITSIPGKQDKYKIIYDQYAEVEIGDVNNSDFKPHAKLKRWGEECHLSVKFPTTKKIKPIKEIDTIGGKNKEKLKWKDNDKEIHFHDNSDNNQNIDSFEYEIVLKNEPSTNIIELDIDTNNLEFYYQGELTPNEIAERCIRPDNKKDSYAVYNLSRQPVHATQADADKYQSCKAFHIDRIKATDANGNWTWCHQNIDINTSKWTITIDQSFLDNATYPVIVDPTFGYTTIGGTIVTTAADPRTCSFTSTVVMNITSMTSYTRATTGTVNVGNAIYSDSGGKPNTKLTTSDTVSTGITPAWKTTNITFAGAATTTYHLALWASASFYYYYDTGVSGQFNKDTTVTWPTWPVTFTPFYTTGEAKKMSIYATYTAGTVYDNSVTLSNNSSSLSATPLLILNPTIILSAASSLGPPIADAQLYNSINLQTQSSSCDAGATINAEVSNNYFNSIILSAISSLIADYNYGVQYGYVEQEANQTYNTDTALQNACTLTFNPLPGDYIVIATAAIGNTDTSCYTTAKLIFDDGINEPVAHGYIRRTTNATLLDYHSIGWIKYINYPDSTNKVIKVQYATSNISGTANIRDIHIFVYQLPTGFVQTATDGEQTFDTVETTLTTANITPDTQQDYLILASFETRSASTTNFAAINMKVDGIIHNTIMTRDVDALNDYYGYQLALVMPNLTAAAHTIELTAFSQNGTMYARRARIIVIPLSTITNYHSQNGTEYSNTNTTWTDQFSYNPVIVNEGDHVIFGSCQYNTGTAGSPIYTNMLLDGTQYQEGAVTVSRFQDIPLCSVKVSNLTAVSHTIKFQNKTTGIATAYIKKQRIIVLQLKQPQPTGTIYDDSVILSAISDLIANYGTVFNEGITLQAISSLQAGYGTERIVTGSVDDRVSGSAMITISPFVDTLFTPSGNIKVGGSAIIVIP